MHRLATIASFAVVATLAACHHTVPPMEGSRPAAGGGGGAGVLQSRGPTLPPGVDSDLIARGDSIFHGENASCIRCHGADASGSANGPSLRSGAWLHSDGSYDRLIATITTGVPRDSLKDATRRFGMNARGGPMNLTDDQVRAVAAYIWSISRAKTSG